MAAYNYKELAKNIKDMQSDTMAVYKRAEKGDYVPTREDIVELVIAIQTLSSAVFVIAEQINNMQR